MILFFLSVGYYFTGDGALRDEDNDYRITGRVDDMLNSKGHRIGTAELECAMVSGRMGVCVCVYFDWKKEERIEFGSNLSAAHQSGGIKFWDVFLFQPARSRPIPSNLIECRFSVCVCVCVCVCMCTCTCIY
jgi:hypothetical protein